MMSGAMLRYVVSTLLSAATIVSPAIAFADPACLPRALFPPDQESAPPKLDLGLIAGVPTLCGLNDANTSGVTGCWTVNAATGELTTSTTTTLPGHSQRGKTDANGCIEGFCPSPKANSDELLLWATSTDGAHAAILRDYVLYVFDTSTKAQTAVIPLSDEKAAENTNVSNEPMEILYAGNAIYVVGADAGPYTAVWSFKDDGTRAGIIPPNSSDERSGGYSVYGGGVNVIDDEHIALIDAGLQTMLVVTAADGKRETLSRTISTAPCTKEEVLYHLDLGDIEIGDGDAATQIGVSSACHATIVKNFEPYFDLDPVQLPSGDFLAALSGKARGTLAILDGKTLVEKSRIELARCAN